MAVTDTDTARFRGLESGWGLSVRVQSGGCTRIGGRVVGVVVLRDAVSTVVSFGVIGSDRYLHAKP